MAHILCIKLSTPVIGQFHQQKPLLLPSWGFFKLEEFVTLDSVSASINYKNIKSSFTKKCINLFYRKFFGYD